MHFAQSKSYYSGQSALYDYTQAKKKAPTNPEMNTHHFKGESVMFER
jgi:hypothetical protein